MSCHTSSYTLHATYKKELLIAGLHLAMEKAMSCIDQGAKKIHDGLKAGNVMEVEAGNKLIEEIAHG